MCTLLLSFKPINTGGNGGEGGKEKNARAQRPGETAGRRARTTAGTETGQSAAGSQLSDS